MVALHGDGLPQRHVQAMTSDQELTEVGQAALSKLVEWLLVSGVDPMDVVMCESTGWGLDGEVITRIWFEGKH